MKTEHLIACAAVGIFLIARFNSVRPAASNIAPVTHDTAGSDWFEDMWARIHGRDLSLDGENPIPDALDAYGMKNAMGWSYQWNGGLNNVGRA